MPGIESLIFANWIQQGDKIIVSRDRLGHVVYELWVFPLKQAVMVYDAGAFQFYLGEIGHPLMHGVFFQAFEFDCLAEDLGVTSLLQRM